jgi:hypothetical protein
MWRSSWLVMRVQASPVTTNSMVREAFEQCHAPTLVSARSAKSRLDHLIQLTDTSRHTINRPSLESTPSIRMCHPQHYDEHNQSLSNDQRTAAQGSASSSSHPVVTKAEREGGRVREI